jgi:aspartate carbamoyltransferase regulatory subunit
MTTPGLSLSKIRKGDVIGHFNADQKLLAYEGVEINLVEDAVP